MKPILIPLRLRSTANLREHWAHKYNRENHQKAVMKLLVMPFIDDLRKATSITLIRHAPRQLDYDNLVYAFKHIRDALSDLIHPGMAPGQADSRLVFSYGQTISKDYGIEVVPIFGTA